MALTGQMTKINMKSSSRLGLCLICHYSCPFHLHYDRKFQYVMKSDIYTCHIHACRPCYGKREQFWDSDQMIMCDESELQGRGIQQQFHHGESELRLLELFKVFLKACRHSEGLSFSFTANLLKWEETNMTTHGLHEHPPDLFQTLA